MSTNEPKDGEQNLDYVPLKAPASSLSLSFEQTNEPNPSVAVEDAEPFTPKVGSSLELDNPKPSIELKAAPKSGATIEMQQPVPIPSAELTAPQAAPAQQSSIGAKTDENEPSEKIGTLGKAQSKPPERPTPKLPEYDLSIELRQSITQLFTNIKNFIRWYREDWPEISAAFKKYEEELKKFKENPETTPYKDNLQVGGNSSAPKEPSQDIMAGSASNEPDKTSTLNPPAPAPVKSVLSEAYPQQEFESSQPAVPSLTLQNTSFQRNDKINGEEKIEAYTDRIKNFENKVNIFLNDIKNFMEDKSELIDATQFGPKKREGLEKIQGEFGLLKKEMEQIEKDSKNVIESNGGMNSVKKLPEITPDLKQKLSTAEKQLDSYLNEQFSTPTANYSSPSPSK